MPDLCPPPSLWQQLWWRVRPSGQERFACAGFDCLDETVPDHVLSFTANSYPQNHTFVARGARLLPNPKLAARLAHLTPHYRPGFESLVDLSCSKGYFVFHAAGQDLCRRALGIDLDGECLSACRWLQARYAHRERVRFEHLTLPELAERIDEFGGPFETALLINTYQYLMFGSDVAPPVGGGHAEVFRLLRRVCSGRLLFHNRLELLDLQHDTQERARALPDLDYSPQSIHAAASEFFHVHRLEPWSRRPLWLLDARPGRCLS